tara:strand:- start:31620 stop:33203 length:1584 start_codon:yes stop_codon:yes gene_type:complete
MENRLLYKAKLLLFFFFLVSCEILDEEPYIQVDTNNYYQNQDDAMDALSGAYARLKSGNGYYRQKFLSTIFASSDQGLSDFLLNNFKNGTVTSTDPNLDVIWKDIYVAIRDANNVIENVPAIEMDEDLKNRILGEAKFLRALHYFNLVRCFGEVPLRLSPALPGDDEGLPLSPISEIYEAIIDDLEFSSIHCWDRLETRGSELNNLGRATKSAANALLAKVYLRMASCKRTALSGVEGNFLYLELPQSVTEYYQLSLERCNLVLTDTGFSLVNNLDGWISIFDAENGNNPEMLFDVQGSDEIGQGTAVSNLFTPRNSGLSGTGFGGNNKLKPRFINFHLNKTDPRFQNSIIRQYQNTSWSFLINNGSTGYRATSLDPQNSNQWWLWQVWTSKYIDTGATTAYSSRQNWHVIRLADVYLMRAESAAELNSNPSLASQDINILRQRVGMSELDTSAMTMDNFRTLLLKERAVELFMEGHRFFDLTRFGVYDEYCRNVLDPIPNTDGSRQPDDYIWPIPITEISANSNIN